MTIGSIARMEFGRCRSCNTTVWWARSAASGTPMPLEEAPEAGNVAVDGIGRAHVFGDHASAFQAIENDDRFPISDTYVSHHARCPDAERYRVARSKRPKPPAPVQEAMPF